LSKSVVLYKCLLCDFATTNLQALRGHLNKHKDVEFENFTVRLPKAICESFRQVCKKRNTTTCHVVLSVLTSIVEGEKQGVVNIATHNPLIIHVNTLVAARPRGRGKYVAVRDVPDGFGTRDPDWVAPEVVERMRIRQKRERHVPNMRYTT